MARIPAALTVRGDRALCPLKATAVHSTGDETTVTATYTVDLWLTSFMDINDIEMSRRSVMFINY